MPAGFDLYECKDMDSMYMCLGVCLVKENGVMARRLQEE